MGSKLSQEKNTLFNLPERSGKEIQRNPLELIVRDMESLKENYNDQKNYINARLDSVSSELKDLRSELSKVRDNSYYTKKELNEIIARVIFTIIGFFLGFFSNYVIALLK